MPQPKLRPRNELVLRALRPNCGLEADYRRRLCALTEQMHRSVGYWVKAAYRENEPVMAQDRSPAEELRMAVRALARGWLSRFDLMSRQLAAYFAKRVRDRTDANLRSILRKGGIAVKFKMTPAMRDVLDATTTANVNLIKSIPQRYLGAVEGMVMRSVQTGRDIAGLTQELEQAYGVTRRRAALIAKHQNNMATASMQRVRQTEMGIKEAVWLHSHGGQTPRRTHIANHGKRYNIELGWFDPDPKVRKRIWPGELINCRCVQKSVVPGFT
jgi:SPP1 gp7 family putative phage head morphogenesis protein